MTREIRLTKGLVAIVDDENFAWLSQWNWHASDGYAVRGMVSGAECGGGTLGMHRVVAGAGAKEVVDHIDRDTLNNCRGNLRICRQRDNARNRVGWATGSSLFKGVCFDRERGLWVGNICIDRRTVFLGRFDREEDAAALYDAAARRAFGAFALCNFPDRADPLPAELIDRLDAFARGDRKPRGNTTKENRAAILARALHGEDYRFIAEDFGISRSAVGGIVFRNKQAALFEEARP